MEHTMKIVLYDAAGLKFSSINLPKNAEIDPYQITIDNKHIDSMEVYFDDTITHTFTRSDLGL